MGLRNVEDGVMLRQFIIDNRNDIIARCHAKTANRPTPIGPIAPTDRGVPMFLDELADELGLGRLPNPQIRKTASTHGHDLQRQGFSVSDVVHGYGDVCQTITEMAVEGHTSIDPNDFRRLNRALDDAIAAAVTQFSSERDLFIEGEASDETARVAAMGHLLWKSIHMARGALDAIKSGRVGIAGSTGTVLDQSLLEADRLVARLLAAEVFSRPRPKTAQLRARA